MLDNPVLLKTQELTKQFVLASEVVTALEGVSLEVRETELLAVMGPSGSGKTTLLSLLGGLDRPTKGKVSWREKDLDNLKEVELAKLRRADIGLVFQDACLMNGLSALDNTQLPLILAGKVGESEWPRQLLERLGLGKRLHRFPGQLSRGEKHRVAIARALANRPTCLLADEPTGNLDRGATLETFSVFRELCQKDGVTVIVATHDQAILDFATRMVTLCDGRITDEVDL